LCTLPGSGSFRLPTTTTLAQFSSLFRRVTVAERAGNTVRVNPEISVMGRTTSRTERHVLTPPEQVLVSGETEGATNTSLGRFAATPEGTIVSAVVEAELTWLTAKSSSWSPDLISASSPPMASSSGL